MMSKITIAIGLALVALGLGFYFGTGRASMTALIPAFVGLPVFILGCVACCGGEGARKHAAHFAVMITLIGALGGLVMGLLRMGKEGKETVVAATLSMAGICIVHVIFSIRSFIAARKAREAAREV
jgi:uncharacterized membrane protein